MDWFADGRDGSGSAADTTTVEVYDSASCQQYSLALSIATAAAALSVEPAELTRKKGRRRKLAPLWRKLSRCVGFARDRPPGARPAGGRRIPRGRGGGPEGRERRVAFQTG